MVASIAIRVWVIIDGVSVAILVSSWIVIPIIKTIVVVVLQFWMGRCVDVIVRTKMSVQIVVVGVGGVRARSILVRSSDSPLISVSVIWMVISRSMVIVISFGDIGMGWVMAKVDGLWVFQRVIMAIVVLIWSDLCWENTILLLIFFVRDIVMSSYMRSVLLNARRVIVVRRNDVMGSIIAVVAGLGVPSLLVSVRLLLRMMNWSSCFLGLFLWLLVFTCFLRLSFLLFRRLLLLSLLLFLSRFCGLLRTLLALLLGKVL